MVTRTQRLLANIQELAPSITSRAAEIEVSRRMPLDLLEALRSIGIFRIFVPESHGGLELDMPTALEIFAALSRIDGSVDDRWRVRHFRFIAATGYLRAGLPEWPRRDDCRLGPACREGRGSGWRLAC